VAEQVNTPSALQTILSKAIESLEPDDSAPAQSRSWRFYDLLVCRYLQQLSVQEVANQLGISHRHLRREQNAALELLAHCLCKQFDIKLQEGAKPDGLTIELVAGVNATVDEELNWLRNLPSGKSTNLSETLHGVIDLVRPLAAQNGVSLKRTLAAELPNLAVHASALRQLLLSLLTFTVERAPGGSVTLWAVTGEWEVEIGIRGHPPSSGLKPAFRDESTALSVARKLADVSGGRLDLSLEAQSFMARLIFPALERLPVLVIDDNADTLALLERYTQGTRYHVIGEQDPDSALRAAEQIMPRLIVLDVMMPNTDGWEVLGRLRQHPLTSHLPVIVCSILAMEGLALSLGANACMRKPVTREVFLATLDQQIGRLERVPR
jgi:CheY-like chemotaxis protein